MSWKKVIIMLVLLSALLGIPFYFYTAGYVDSWQQQLILDLENRFNLEIDYQDVNLLPVNRFSIGELYVSGDEFSLEISQLNIYYDLNRFLSRLYRERLEIELVPAVLDSLEVIEAEGLKGEVNRPEAENLQIQEFGTGAEIDPLIIWDYLPSLPTRAQIVINDGSISYSEFGGEAKIDALKVEAASPTREELELAAAGNVEVTGLELPGFNPDSLAFTEVVVDSSLARDSWALDTQLQLQLSEGSLEMLAEQQDIGLDSINYEGLSPQRISASLEGSGSELKRMQIDGSGSLESLSLEADSQTAAEFSPDIDFSGQPEIEITELNWDVNYDQESGNIYLPALEFSLFQGEFSGSGYVSAVNPDEDFLLELEGKDINLDDVLAVAGEDNLEEQREISSYQVGTGNIRLQTFTGDDGPEMEITADIAESSVNGEEFTGQFQAYWQQEMLTVEQAEIDFGAFSSPRDHLETGETEEEPENKQQKIDMTGVLDTNTLDYDFDLQAKNLSVDLLENFLLDESYDLFVQSETLAEYWPRGGLMNFKLNGAGQGTDFEEFQTWAEVNIDQLKVDDFPRATLQGEVWFSDGKLDVSLFTLETSPLRLDITGVIDVYQEDLDLRLETDTVNLQEMTRIFPAETEELAEEISGEAELTGRITGGFTGPNLSAVVHVPRADIAGLEIREGWGEISFLHEEEKLLLEELDFRSREASVISQGSLDISPADASYLDLDMDIENLSYEYINDLFDLELPLTGDVGGYVNIYGPLDDIRVSSQARSASTVFAPEFAPEFTLEFKNSRSNFYWQQGEPFQVIDLHMEREQAVFNMDADFDSDHFTADFHLQNYQLQHAVAELPQLNYDIAGSADISGQASGSYEDPNARAELEVADISLQEMLLGSLTGEAQLEQGELVIPGARWEPGSGRLEIGGRINNIISEREPELDLSLQVEELEPDYYLQQLGYELEFPIPYYFTGNINLTGTAADPAARIDASLIGEEFGWGEINLSGEISDHYDLSLFGSGIQLSYMVGELPVDYADLQGGIQVEGELAGPLESPRAELATRILDVRINGYNLQEVTGKAVLDEDLNLSLQQELLAGPDSSLNVNADFSLQEEIQEGSFIVSAEDFSLDVVENFLPQEMSLTGKLNGEVEGRGSLTDPQLSGRLDVNLDELDIGQPENIAGSTGLLFAEDKVEVVDTSFQMGEGSLDISGFATLADLEDIWDIEVQADDLPVEYEGSTADISGELEISGALYSPQITGSTRFDNLIAVLPEGETEVPEQVSTGEGEFNPRADITVNVGRDNYVQHENAEIKIEEGNLRLIYRDRLTIEGRLTSRQGWAFFYNNRFSLESARVEFASSRGVIPRINVRAATRTQGTNITVNIEGTPDNITTSFTSTPEMSEQEILGLLTRRGGVGGFISGEDRSIPGLIFQETRRFISDTLQLQILGWQRTLREQLELDRLEIITHDLGWDEEVSLYVGKDLTDRLYIETQSEFGSDNHQTDVILDYALSEYTSLGVNLQDINPEGWKDYSITIETGIEF